MSQTGTSQLVDPLLGRIEAALRPEFPTDTVDVTAGYANNIHIVVVSRRFDGLGESEKQELLWSILDQGNFTDAEKGRISLMLTYSPANLK